QLSKPGSIKDLIPGDFTPVCPLLVKMLHAWVFRQLRHEHSPLSQLAAACKFVSCNRPYTLTGTSFLDAFQSCRLMKSGARRRMKASCFGLPWPNLEGPGL